MYTSTVQVVQCIEIVWLSFGWSIQLSVQNGRIWLGHESQVYTFCSVLHTFAVVFGRSIFETTRVQVYTGSILLAVQILLKAFEYNCVFLFVNNSGKSC